MNRLLVDKARAGKCVVRLKGGDPYVFGRGGEEAEELAAAGVPFEVVPGISSSIAGPNYAGHSLDASRPLFELQRHHRPRRPDQRGCRCGLGASGKGARDKSSIDGRDAHRENRASAHGQRHEGGDAGGGDPLGDNRPATIGFWDVEDHRGRCRKAKFQSAGDHCHWRSRAHAGEVELVRKALRCLASASWSPAPAQQASQLARQLLERGADVLEIPVIRTIQPTDRQAIADVLLELNSYDWLVFTSPNGVTRVLRVFLQGVRRLARHWRSAHRRRRRGYRRQNPRAASESRC